MTIMLNSFEFHEKKLWLFWLVDFSQWFTNQSEADQREKENETHRHPKASFVAASKANANHLPTQSFQLKNHHSKLWHETLFLIPSLHTSLSFSIVFSDFKTVRAMKSRSEAVEVESARIIIQLRWFSILIYFHLQSIIIEVKIARSSELCDGDSDFKSNIQIWMTFDIWYHESCWKEDYDRKFLQLKCLLCEHFNLEIIFWRNFLSTHSDITRAPSAKHRSLRAPSFFAANQFQKHRSKCLRANYIVEK